MILKDKKSIAIFELSLMIMSIFSFTFLLSNYGQIFEKTPVEDIYEFPNQANGNQIFQKVIDKIKKPMIGRVLAVGNIGCCEENNEGVSCSSITSNECAPASAFSPGASCESTSYCKAGCCYDVNAGIFSANTLQKDCSAQWDGSDPFCNIDGSQLGCCVLDLNTKYVTQGACKVFNDMAFGEDSNLDWRGDMDNNECVLYRTSKEQGACVFNSKSCEFTTQELCFNNGGQFSIGSLCTSTALNTTCEKTDQTTCVEGRDQVYFTDSCGNVANIYDSSKAEDQSYWETIIEAENSCGYNDAEGNANSASCGNCHRFAGGFCSSASKDGFDVESGDNYCKSTSCTYEGKTYKNGESFCVYDGKVGDGDDVVGSLHRSLYCNYGEMDTLLCGDYRNGICATKDTYNIQGTNVEFRDSECLLNPWRNCLSLNNENVRGDRDLVETCEAAPYCAIEEVHLADKFKFDVCVPQHPAGWDFGGSLSKGGSVCSEATRTCVVLRKAKPGKCVITENAGCLKSGFTEGMNDFCRKLGDCGLETNIAGEYTDNYNIKKAPRLSTSWIEGLVALALPTTNHVPWINLDPLKLYLALEEFSDLVLGGSGSGGGAEEALSNALLVVGAIGAIAGAAATTIGSTAIAGAINAIAGAGTVGPGAIAGVAGVIGLVALVAIVIIIILQLLTPKCPPIIVEFTCQPWQPPFGGDNCELCNEDQEICTQYRCESLGVGCGLINRGSKEQACVNQASGDSIPPIINPSEEIDYDIFNVVIETTPDGHKITSKDGSCLEANTFIPVSLATDERTQCKYAFEVTEWENMDSLGNNFYTTEHTMLIQLPNPNHGQSLGLNVTENLNVYVLCQDLNGNRAPLDHEFYVINMCVNQGPDITPPVIYTYSPVENTFVSVDETSRQIAVTTNELSTCRWSTTDKVYDLMENEMICDNDINLPSSPWGYLCSIDVPITGITNDYYIRCADQPWLNFSNERNAMQESLKLTLNKPDKKIQIDSIIPIPNEDIKVPTGLATVKLEVRTSGGGAFPWCRYSFDGYGGNKGDIFVDGNGTHIHTQTLNLAVGYQKIYIECFDETGDSEQKTTEFRIIKDTSAPQIARVWQDGNLLKVVTTEFVECRYTTNSCSFNWESGTSVGNGKDHVISVVGGTNYYIKCMDDFGNIPFGCSINVKAV